MSLAMRSALLLTAAMAGRVTQHAFEQGKVPCGCNNKVGVLAPKEKLVGIDIAPDPSCSKPGVHASETPGRFCSCDEGYAKNWDVAVGSAQKRLDDALQPKIEALQSLMDQLQEKLGVEIDARSIGKVKPKVTSFPRKDGEGLWVCCCQSQAAGKCKKNAEMENGWIKRGVHHAAPDRACEDEIAETAETASPEVTPEAEPEPEEPTEEPTEEVTPEAEPEPEEPTEEPTEEVTPEAEPEPEEPTEEVKAPEPVEPEPVEEESTPEEPTPEEATPEEPTPEEPTPEEPTPEEPTVQTEDGGSENEEAEEEEETTDTDGSGSDDEASTVPEAPVPEAPVPEAPVPAPAPAPRAAFLKQIQGGFKLKKTKGGFKVTKPKQGGSTKKAMKPDLLSEIKAGVKLQPPKARESPETRKPDLLSQIKAGVKLQPVKERKPEVSPSREPTLMDSIKNSPKFQALTEHMNSQPEEEEDEEWED